MDRPDQRVNLNANKYRDRRPWSSSSSSRSNHPPNKSFNSERRGPRDYDHISNDRHYYNEYNDYDEYTGSRAYRAFSGYSDRNRYRPDSKSYRRSPPPPLASRGQYPDQNSEYNHRSLQYSKSPESRPPSHRGPPINQTYLTSGNQPPGYSSNPNYDTKTVDPRIKSSQTASAANEKQERPSLATSSLSLPTSTTQKFFKSNLAPSRSEQPKSTTQQNPTLTSTATPATHSTIKFAKSNPQTNTFKNPQPTEQKASDNTEASVPSKSNEPLPKNAGQTDTQYWETLKADLKARKYRLNELKKIMGLPNNNPDPLYRTKKEKEFTDYPIPYIDRILKTKNRIEQEGQNEEPVLNVSPWFVLDRIQMDKALCEEANTHIQPVTEKGLEGLEHMNKDIKICSVRSLLKLSYIKALERSNESQSFVFKNDLLLLSSRALCFAVAQKYLQKSTESLKKTKKELETRQEELKKDVKFEIELNGEVSSIHDISLWTTNKSRTTTDMLNESKRTQNIVLLKGLGTQLTVMKGEVSRLMGCLQFVIDEHIAPYIADHCDELINAPLQKFSQQLKNKKSNYFHSFKSATNSHNPSSGTNLVSLSRNGTTSKIATNKQDNGTASAADADSDVDIQTWGSQPALIANNVSPITINTSSSLALNNLTSGYDVTSPKQIADRMKKILAFLLNQHMDAKTATKDICLQVSDINDPIIKMMLQCQIALQAPEAPNLIRLRDFGKPITNSSNITILIP